MEDNEEWEKVYDDDADDDNAETENGDNDPGNHSSYGQINMMDVLQQNSIVVTEQGPLINARLGIFQYKNQIPKSPGLIQVANVIKCIIPVFASSYYSKKSNIMPCNGMLCGAMLWYVMLCDAMLCNAMVCYVM